MAEIELTKAGQVVNYTVYDNGKVVGLSRFNPHVTAQVNKAARDIGVDVPTVYDWVSGLGKEPKTFQTGQVKPDQVEMYTRAFEEARSPAARIVGPPVTLLERFLVTEPLAADLLLDWSDAAACCCLDVDYHGVKPIRPDAAKAFVSLRLAPAPIGWHFSRSGGLHLFYIRSGDFDANELAAVAGLRWKMMDPTAGVELKTQVRGPGAVECNWIGRQDTGGLLSQWLGTSEFSTDERDDWLAERGMAIDERYDADHCPMNPVPDGGQYRQPVMVSETGVYCHHCAGKDISLGSKRPGFAPWAALLGSPSSGPIGKMVRGLAHWGQAKLVLEDTIGLTGSMARLAYSAALKAYHADKPTFGLVRAAFSEDTTTLVRLGDAWANAETGVEYVPRNLKLMLPSLPAVQYLDDKGDVKVNSFRLGKFDTADPLAEFGYPRVNVIGGYRFTKTFIPEDYRHDGVPVVRTAPWLTRKPRYVPYSARPPQDEYWGRLETLFPKLDRNLIRLLLAAAGTAQETNLGLPPWLFVGGPSGSAKTSHCGVACGILGVGSRHFRWNREEARFYQALAETANETPIAVCDEVFKDAARGRWGVSAYEALQPMFDAKTDTTYHKMYVGNRRIGRTFALVLTEIMLPYAVSKELQVSRRLRQYKLYDMKTWDKSRVEHRVTDLARIRLLNQKVNEACDCILSEVTDSFFATPMGWDEIAESLGALLVKDHPEFADEKPQLRLYFKLLCGEPDVSAEGNKRLLAMLSADGRGWKKISRTECPPDGNLKDIVVVYSAFADDAAANWGTARRLAEQDWSGVLGSDRPVVYQQKEVGGNVYARFVSGPLKTPSHVNHECYDPEKVKES